MPSSENTADAESVAYDAHAILDDQPGRLIVELGDEDNVLMVDETK